MMGASLTERARARAIDQTTDDLVSAVTRVIGPLPNADEAEVAVLSACLADPSTVGRLDEQFSRAVGDDSAAVFHREAHRHLWRAMLRITESDTPLDVISLVAELRRRAVLEAAGGLEYVAELDDDAFTAANVGYHAELVVEAAQRRRIISLASEAIAAAQDPGVRLDAIGETLSAAAAPVHRGGDGGFVLARDVVWTALDEIERASRGELVGVLTGYPELDDVFHGFRGGELIVQVNASGHGKTATALNIALNTTIEHGTATAIVLAEGTKVSAVHRAFAMLAYVDTRDIRSGACLRNPDQAQRLIDAGRTLASLPLWLDEAPLATVRSVARKLRALKREHPDLSLVVIDYLQLLQGDGSTRAENRARELDLIANTLKGLAVELDVCVYALAQPNAKDVEGRENPKPTLRDIAWSQAIRNAADVILLGYLPHMYETGAPANGHRMEIEVAKGRNLPTFRFSLEWDGPYLLLDSPLRRQRRRERASARQQDTSAMNRPSPEEDGPTPGITRHAERGTKTVA